MSSARPAPSPARDLLFLLAFFVVIYWLPTGLRPLVNPDEGRYVEIAREMATTGDLVSPHLNGTLYFEKPPLFYWLEASAVKLGGMNLWALRFWPIALAFIAAAAVYGTGRKLWGRAAGLWAAAVLSTGVLFYGLAQIIILDMAVSVFLTLALCAFMLAVREPPGKTRRWWCWALYAAMALALLTKGLIGLVIPGAIIFLWLLLLNKWRELRHAHIFSGFLVLLILAAPWHIAAALANPPPDGWDWPHFVTKDWNNQGFLWYYFWHEHVLRYTDPETAHHVQGWYFFPGILLAGLLPWAFFLPQALWSAVKGGWLRLKAEPEILLLLLWTLFPLGFFSASASKLIPYILPSIPPLALLIGRFLARAQEVPGAPALLWPLRIAGGCALAVAAVLPFLPNALGDKIPAGATPWFGGLTVLFLLCGVASLHSTLGKNRRPDLTILLACTSIFLLAFNPISANFLNVRKPSTAPAAAWLRPQLTDSDQVFVLNDYGAHQDFPPLLGRLVGVAGNVPQEQEFGLMLETEKFTARYPGIVAYLKGAHPPQASPAQPPPAPSREEILMPPFLAILRGAGRVFVFVKADQFPDFQKNYPGVPVHELWHDDHFVIFSNQPEGK